MLNKYHMSALIVALSIHLYFYQSDRLKELDYKFYDITQERLSHLKEESSSYTVIVDIDEKSLQQLGQWPWSRVINAKLVDAIHSMNPSALGINILFPEKDRTSPIAIKEFYQKFFNLDINLEEFPKELQDNDRLFAQSIKESSATLSTYFTQNSYTNEHCKKLLYRENLFKQMKSDLNSTSLLCNYQPLQESSNNFGFINASEDSDGVFRRIPLFVDYNNHIFPSFALATVLSFDKYLNLENKKESMLLNFSTKPKVFSAIDILNGNISPKEIQGKVVILGSSIIGSTPNYTLSNGRKVSSSMIHALVIDNILENSFVIEEDFSKNLNLTLSFLLSILVTILLFKRLYLYVVLLFIVTSLISFTYLINSFLAGVYVSIAYLWLPFLLFFIIILLYQIQFIDRERHKQEKLLIRQSKLASMGEIISLIAHQWRQPLSAINGTVLNIDMNLRKNNFYNKEIDNHLNEIEAITEYLSKTINDFTDFFSSTKKSETFTVVEIIEQAKKLIPLSSYQEISIEYNRDEDVKIQGYRLEMVQSILIILNNAIYASKENLQKVDEKGKITIHTYMQNNSIFISIEDSGEGIEKKKLKRIFNPYFTTKNKEHGTGLGLYILKLIIENSMNGKVFVSNGEKGAIFTIKIPKKIL